MPDASSPWIQFGYVLKAHGVRGEIRVVSQSDFPFPNQVKILRLIPKNGIATNYTVKSIRAVHQAYLMTFKGISGRNEAEALKGATVHIPQSSLPKLEAGEYYLFELIGMVVQSPDGEEYGEVVAIMDNAGQPLLRIMHGDKERLLPGVREIIVSFDRETKRLVVQVPEGLWE